MGNQASSGLTKRGGVWHIDKVFRGVRIRESTGTGDLDQAEEQLAARIDSIRKADVFGVRPDRKFRVAATKYLDENQHKKIIADDAGLLKQLDPFIGDLMLKQVHLGTLQPFIAKRQQDKVKTRTITAGLEVVRHILNLAEGEWRDERGLTWIERAPKIKLFPIRDKRPPYPLSREEQALFFPELPDYLARIVFVHLPKGEQELQPLARMNNTAWRNARERAANKWEVQTGQPAPTGLRRVRVHDMKHTFGRRLRAAGVSFEDRQDLLGHKSGRITTHYSAAELANLIAAAELVCDENSRKSPASTWLRRRAG
jgi:integrase